MGAHYGYRYSNQQHDSILPSASIIYVSHGVCASLFIIASKLAPNSEDHSQIVRFVSSFISDELVGNVRAVVLMGVVLPSYVGVRQQKRGFTPT